MVSAPNVQIIGSNGRGIAVDGPTNTLQTIDYAHHEIHGGSHYLIENFISTGSGDVTTFGVTVPDSEQWPHIRWSISAGKSAEFEVKESAAFSGGSAITPVNNNRNSTKTSTLAVVSGPSVTDTGTSLLRVAFGVTGAGFFNPGSGGEGGRENELILKRNTKYLFQITSNTASNVISYHAFWYEHEDKTA